MIVSVNPNSLRNYELYNKVYRNICYPVIMFFVPIGILSFTSVRLIQAIRSSGKLQSNAERNTERNNQITKVLVAVILVFCVCQTPALITQILITLLPKREYDCGRFFFYWSPVSNTLALLISSVNCLIYILLNKGFRRKLCQQ